MENLMTPRVIVTALYPDSPFEVGDILTLEKHSETNILYVKQNGLLGDFVGDNEVYKCTGVFRQLHWWEFRDEKDMPEYVKGSDSVYKIKKWDMIDMIGWINKREACDLILWSNGDPQYQYQPSTATEYEKFKNQ